MCVKVFLAIRALLSKRENITVVGEAATLSEAIQKTEELHPDEIILDLHMADGTKRQLSNGTKLLAIFVCQREEAEALDHEIGAVKLLDKMELAYELIPTILELHQRRQCQPGWCRFSTTYQGCNI